MSRFFFGIVLLFFFTGTFPVYAEDVELDGRVPGCGDGVIEFAEACDLSSLNGQSCTTLGFSGGVLGCTVLCAYDTSSCTVSSGGGGGGGGSRTNTSRSLVALEGFSVPFGQIFLLVDGAISASTTADQLGRFRFSARNLDAGTYQFSMYARDAESVQSATYSFFTTLKSRTVIKYDAIVLSPTLTSDLSGIDRDDALTVRGGTLPAVGTQITVRNSNGVVRTFAATSSSAGRFTYTLPASTFTQGNAVITTQSTFLGSTTPQSRPLSVQVGDTTVVRTNQGSVCGGRADLNTDCRVNLIDFSIMLFWFKQPLSGEFTNVEKERLSGDGLINFTDFSILLYAWTG